MILEKINEVIFLLAMAQRNIFQRHYLPPFLSSNRMRGRACAHASRMCRDDERDDETMTIERISKNSVEVVVVEEGLRIRVKECGYVGIENLLMF